jgi:predicted RNase H-like HicB family nuclease
MLVARGKTEDEALENIQDAIREYLEAAVKISKGAKLREVIRNNSFGTEG